MAEYINKAELLEQIGADSVGREGQYGDEWIFMDTITDMPTIESPEAPPFKTEAEGIAYLVGTFSVALNIVHCRECKHWKDSDGVYRRGFGAESKCRVNCEKVMRGDWFCADGQKK